MSNLTPVVCPTESQNECEKLSTGFLLDKITPEGSFHITSDYRLEHCFGESVRALLSAA